jgi:hypothetical protein
MIGGPRPSLAADAAADGVDSEWWRVFASQASGLRRPSPRIIGFGAVASNISRARRQSRRRWS